MIESRLELPETRRAAQDVGTPADRKKVEWAIVNNAVALVRTPADEPSGAPVPSRATQADKMLSPGASTT